MTNEYSADLSWPSDGAIGPSSPVQQTLKILRQIINDTPVPEVTSRAAYFVAPLLATHILHLLEGAGQLNGWGYHSAAVSLFRTMEDALDCFAAVSLIPGAADSWLKGELKASDAAKLWVAGENESFQYVHGGVSLSDYRKGLRSQFNKYTHCSFEQTEWNLYFEHKEENNEHLQRLRLNLKPMVINKHAHRIDAHLTASLYEFVELVKEAFSEYLARNEQIHLSLKALEAEISVILKRHKEHGCFDVTRATEVQHLVYHWNGTVDENAA